MTIERTTYWRSTGEEWKHKELTVEEYQDWLLRAGARGYRATKEADGSYWISGGEGKTDFRIKIRRTA